MAATTSRLHAALGVGACMHGTHACRRRGASRRPTFCPAGQGLQMPGPASLTLLAGQAAQVEPVWPGAQSARGACRGQGRGVGRQDGGGGLLGARGAAAVRSAGPPARAGARAPAHGGGAPRNAPGWRRWRAASRAPAPPCPPPPGRAAHRISRRGAARGSSRGRTRGRWCATGRSGGRGPWGAAAGNRGCGRGPTCSSGSWGGTSAWRGAEGRWRVGVGVWRGRGGRAAGGGVPSNTRRVHSVRLGMTRPLRGSQGMPTGDNRYNMHFRGQVTHGRFFGPVTIGAASTQHDRTASTSASARDAVMLRRNIISTPFGRLSSARGRGSVHGTRVRRNRGLRAGVRLCNWV